MRYFKTLISTLIIITILLSLAAGVFAADDEKNYDVNYKEFNLYRSVVSYVKVYPITYNGYEVLEGNNSYNTEVKIDGKIIKKDDTVVIDKLGKYAIKVYQGNTTFKTVTGDLVKGKNEITVEFKNFRNTNCKYQFNISVKEKNTDKIDNKKFDWVKVEKPVIKWVNELKYGPYINKKVINLGDLEKYTTTKPVFAKGKVFYYLNGKASNLYYTGNTKLKLGENKLLTKNILFNKDKKLLYWFKAEFIIDLNVPGEVTPNTEITPEPTQNNQTPTNSNYYNDKLPNTGDTSTIIFIIVGFIILAAGFIIFVKRDSIIKNH
jgi:LPXTG-motif cell wall-anchored protein